MSGGKRKGLDEGHKDDATKELRGGRQIDTHRPETDRRLTKSNKVVQMVFHAAFTATLTKKLKQKDKTGNCVPPRPVRTKRGSRHIRHLSDNEKQLPRTQKRTAEQDVHDLNFGFSSVGERQRKRPTWPEPANTAKEFKKKWGVVEQDKEIRRKIHAKIQDE
ncbi:hypothetical protein RUM44_002999 [Polyplax serrata]|uniref:Uncharacterized protein n=1 Tax=Polyplax serrata TaxID=468196 RepID=A0ABR1AXP6_POLSC